ncbi:DMT family transporter [Cryptosporangium aurantiacum]|uniref:Small multidrug resistance pump n=1 Tax=Cryptosporangium aurantiacum TaxID=134849 RepID=A0A1M7RHF7_9ACTN|nr:multidrug efflux SMR transporter [Cryptosporangium aurantiacum]SHN45660.1 small multidrug resistance pump [Cryptosporangium aurantiacum]
MGAWVWLASAIVAEVIATSALKASNGFTVLWASIVVVLGYGFSFVGLSQALKLGLGLGTAYAVWAGVGTGLIAIIGWVVFGDRLGIAAISGILLIVAGVVLVNLSGAGHTEAAAPPPVSPSER